VSGFAPMLDVLAGQPGVQIVLCRGGQGAVADGGPVQQCDRRSDVLLNDDDLGVAGVFGTNSTSGMVSHSASC
jgi:protein-disulfide isomerase-like protein with CxxC motif